MAVVRFSGVGCYVSGFPTVFALKMSTNLSVNLMKMQTICSKKKREVVNLSLLAILKIK
jgi:hypothetical protein